MPLSLSSLFQETVFPVVVCGGLRSQSMEGRAANCPESLSRVCCWESPFPLVSFFFFFCHLLGGWSNSSAAGQCFGKCKLSTKITMAQSWAEPLHGGRFSWRISNPSSETEKSFIKVKYKNHYSFLISIFLLPYGLTEYFSPPPPDGKYPSSTLCGAGFALLCWKKPQHGLTDHLYRLEKALTPGLSILCMPCFLPVWVPVRLLASGLASVVLQVSAGGSGKPECG